MNIEESKFRHEPIEELAEEIWALREEDRNKFDILVGGSKLEDSRSTFLRMQEQGLVRRDGKKIDLTPAGEEIARKVIRRHRLSEVLLQQVLEVEEREADRTACEFEHQLSDQVTRSVCTYLGHPAVCPHGKEIPKGDCCNRLVEPGEPLVIRLSDMRPGEAGRIVFILPENRARLAKLSCMGIVPGQVIRLERKWPSVVITKEEATLAMDREVGREIYVKRVQESK